MLNTELQTNPNDAKPIVLSVCLVIAAILVLLTFWQFPDLNFWIYFSLFLVIDLGFIVAMIAGIRTQNIPVVIFSVIANGVSFLMLSTYMYLLLLGHGIS